MKSKIFLFVFCMVVPSYKTLKGDIIGCYIFDSKFINTHSGGSVEICTSACEQIYYRYAVLTNGSYCFCGNSPGIAIADPALCNMQCPRNGSQLCGGEKAGNVYDTDFVIPGPPTDIKITDITETTVHVWWKMPEAHGPITKYRIKSYVINSFESEFISKIIEWDFINTTFHTQLVNLHPGTLYNITICALHGDTVGVETHAEVETVIGTPEPSPPEVRIIERRGDNMLIRIPPTFNINGPITKYRIVVINEDLLQGFTPDYLKSYYEAMEEDIPYYITAELDPREAKEDFTIGNKRNYNGYFNAPLPPTKDIRIALGVVSTKRGVTKERYTHSSDVMILNVNEDEETSGLVLTLGVAIAFGMVLLFIGLGVVIVMRRRVGVIRRQRFSQSMQLSGPSVEIENTGFIPDEEERVDHYSNLKRQLWNIPRNFLEVDTGSTVGMGTFGQFVRGRVQHQGIQKPSLVQAVADGELSRSDRKIMLGELDLLIKSNGHENVVSLIGICESPTMLYVVIEDTRHTLKELLISSRHRDIQNNKFSLISENTIMKIILGVSKGMEYLNNKKILHKKLCCRNIIMADGSIPKVSGFGLSHMHLPNEKPDYTRWTAQEMFRQNTYQFKSDVWSYGCLVWEALSLGGTPYANVTSKELAARVLRGARPSQLPYVGDELYQLCLHCWQLDLDERPHFSEISKALRSLVDQDNSGIISFTYYNGFQYELHSPELETLH